MSIRETFPNSIALKLIINIIQKMWSRFQYCSDPSTMLLLKGPLKRDFLEIYVTTFLESVISEIQNLWGSTLFSKCSKFDLDFKNAEKNSDKGFFFSDNIIWISIVKLPMLGTGYLSLAANVLTRSSKIWHVNNRNFFQLNCFGTHQ